MPAPVSLLSLLLGLATLCCAGPHPLAAQTLKLEGRLPLAAQQCLEIRQEKNSYIIGGSGKLAKAQLWSWPDSNLVATLEGSGNVACLAWSPENGWLYGGGYKQPIKIWTSPTEKPFNFIDRRETRNIRCMDFTRKSGMLVAGGYRRTPVWRTSTGVQELRTEPHRDLVTAIHVLPGDSLIVSAGMDSMLVVQPLESGRKPLQWRAHQDQVTDLALDPEGRWVASTGRDHCLRVWNPYTGEQLYEDCNFRSAVSSVAVSPDGRLLFVGGWYDPLRIYNAVSWQRLAPQDPPLPEGVQRIAISPDGQLLVTSLDVAETLLWRVE